jgi:hypothetical protein
LYISISQLDIAPMAVYAFDGGDESETTTEQEIKQKNIGSGDSTNNNCALNSIDSAAATVACLVTQLGPRTATLDEPSSALEELPSTPEVE